MQHLIEFDPHNFEIAPDTESLTKSQKVGDHSFLWVETIPCVEDILDIIGLKMSRKHRELE